MLNIKDDVGSYIVTWVWEKGLPYFGIIFYLCIKIVQYTPYPEVAPKKYLYLHSNFNIGAIYLVLNQFFYIAPIFAL